MNSRIIITAGLGVPLSTGPSATSVNQSNSTMPANCCMRVACAICCKAGKIPQQTSATVNRILFIGNNHHIFAFEWLFW